ncbi:MAG: hypothetical protein ACRCZ0_04370 [Cetobacterium sp.]
MKMIIKKIGENEMRIETLKQSQKYLMTDSVKYQQMEKEIQILNEEINECYKAINKKY